MVQRFLHYGGLLLTLCFAGGAAVAGSFSVTPVRVTLTASEPIVALTIRNGGEEPAVVQIEATSWTQHEGVERYEPTRDLIVTPPIFTVPPQGSQVVRLRMRQLTDPKHELTYRVFLTEVAPPPRPGFIGMQVALRLGVPVFVTPAVAGAQVLQWQLVQGTDRKLAIAARNGGALHARIAKISLSPPGGAPVFEQTVAADIHAGQRREWSLANATMPPTGTSLRLLASTERGDVQADVVVP